MDDAAPRVMWSVSQIAERDGVSKQAVSKTVQSLIEKHGLPVERDMRGRVARVSLAAYDHHRGLFVNPAKVAGSNGAPPKPPGGEVPRGDSFDEARRQNEWLKVEREKLAQAEERGKLLRTDKLGDALDRIGREIQSLNAKLPNKADDIALAGAKEGVHGVRVALRDIAFEMNSRIAALLADIAEAAPANDPAMADETP